MFVIENSANIVSNRIIKKVMIKMVFAHFVKGSVFAQDVLEMI